MDSSMRKLYIKEAKTSLDLMKKALKALDKDHNDRQELFRLYRGAHTLKSSSMQVGYYNVGYFAALLCDVINSVQEGAIKTDDLTYAFLADFTGSLEQSLRSMLTRKGKMFCFHDAMNELFRKEEMKRQERRDLANLYYETSRDLINDIDHLLIEMRPGKKSKNTSVINIRCHTLEGNSLQFGEYLMAYFASRLKRYVKDVDMRKPTQMDIQYMHYLSETLRTYLRNLEKGKPMLSRHLKQKLFDVIRDEYTQTERRIRR